jgi:ribosomal protein S27AE
LRRPRIVIIHVSMEQLPQLAIACPACGGSVTAVVDGEKARWACPRCLLVGAATAIAIELPLVGLPFAARPPASA